MDIIQKLLTIESEAQEAMNDLAKEESQLQKKTEAQLAARLAKIEREGGLALEKLKKQAGEAATARLAQIKADYQQKSQEFSETLHANQQQWQEKIFHDVLYG